MKKGFSLIETLVYIGIFSLVSVVAVNLFIMAIDSVAKNRVLQKINTSAEISMERMVREIRGASSIDINESVFGVNPGILQLNTIDQESGASTTVKFNVSNNAILITKENFSPQALTVDGVLINSLVFRNISASSTSVAVKIEMEIEASWLDYVKSEKFYDTVILRGSY